MVLCRKIKDSFANLASKVKEKVYLSYFRFTRQSSFIGKKSGELVVFVFLFIPRNGRLRAACLQAHLRAPSPADGLVQGMVLQPAEHKLMPGESSATLVPQQVTEAAYLAEPGSPKTAA